MESPRTNSVVNVEVVPALLEQAPIVANLLELYVYDFSELVDLKLGADGRFGYAQLPLYWTEPNRYPFLIRVDSYWAGFVLVRRGSQISGDEDTWDMAEFFVLRGYRRLGLGTRVAHEVWKRLPGKWEVRVRGLNTKAKDFWRAAISEFVGEAVGPTTFEKNSVDWHIFSFESCAKPG